jgi:hypothetical protein
LDLHRPGSKSRLRGEGFEPGRATLERSARTLGDRRISSLRRSIPELVGSSFGASIRIFHLTEGSEGCSGESMTALWSISCRDGFLTKP